MREGREEGRARSRVEKIQRARKGRKVRSGEYELRIPAGTRLILRFFSPFLLFLLSAARGGPRESRGYREISREDVAESRVGRNTIAP